MGECRSWVLIGAVGSGQVGGFGAWFNSEAREKFELIKL